MWTMRGGSLEYLDHDNGRAWLEEILPAPLGTSHREVSALGRFARSPLLAWRQSPFRKAPGTMGGGRSQI